MAFSGQTAQRIYKNLEHGLTLVCIVTILAYTGDA